MEERREGVARKSSHLFSHRGSEPEIRSSPLAWSRSPGGHSWVSAEKSNRHRTKMTPPPRGHTLTQK